MISFTIPLNPVSKKNSQQIVINRATGRPFIMPSAKYKAYEREVRAFLPNHIFLSCPVEIKCLFYMKTRHQCDLPNMLNAIDDILVKYKIIADDNSRIVVSHDGSRILYDKENPRTEVYIKPIMDGDG